jgi:hypothetical protein
VEQEAELKPEQITYPPLDTLKAISEDAWIVDSGPIKAMGFLKLPVRMTVMRLGDGTLMLHSPTRFTPSLRLELERIGPVAHLVAPNIAHWTFARAWQEHCPRARMWAAPGLSQRAQVRRSGLRIDDELRAGPLADWPDEIERIVIRGAGFAEVALFAKRTKLLVLTDLIVNLEREKLPVLLRPPARLAGVVAPNGKAPVYLRAIIRMRRERARAAARRLLACRPEYVVFSHGHWFERDAEARLRRALAWLVD